MRRLRANYGDERMSELSGKELIDLYMTDKAKASTKEWKECAYLLAEKIDRLQDRLDCAIRTLKQIAAIGNKGQNNEE